MASSLKDMIQFTYQMRIQRLISVYEGGELRRLKIQITWLSSVFLTLNSYSSRKSKGGARIWEAPWASGHLIIFMSRSENTITLIKSIVFLLVIITVLLSGMQLMNGHIS